VHLSLKKMAIFLSWGHVHCLSLSEIPVKDIPSNFVFRKVIEWSAFYNHFNDLSLSCIPAQDVYANTKPGEKPKAVYMERMHKFRQRHSPCSLNYTMTDRSQQYQRSL
jgi:hypothetical protein